MVDFLKYRFACLLFSLSILAAFCGLYVYRTATRGAAFNYSIDFTGGTQALLKFNKSVDSASVRSILEAAGWQNVDTREFTKQGDHQEILVRLQEWSNDAKGLSDRVRQALLAAMPETTIEVLQSETVSAGVGKELQTQSIFAVLLALILMLMYIAWRFWSYSFAVGAVVALAHDALIMVFTFLIFDRPISVGVIAAILAVLGYSINDTIVIFSQIRGNLVKAVRGTPLADTVNLSLNQTLRRTILTSVSTALTVGSMFILGGEALYDFSLALLVGIVFGTYSSIYIASPIMMLLYKEEN